MPTVRLLACLNAASVTHVNGVQLQNFEVEPGDAERGDKITLKMANEEDWVCFDQDIDLGEEADGIAQVDAYPDPYDPEEDSAEVVRMEFLRSVPLHASDLR